MALTRKQALAAAWLLALAGGAGGAGGIGDVGAPPSPGAGLGGGPKVGSPVKVPAGSAGGKKVSTPQGAAFYHLPIGALIIPHSQPVMTTGGKEAMPPEPTAMPKGWIPEPKWLEGQAEWEAIWKANEWKGHGSKHIWAHGHMFSVPDDADVFVDKDVDADNDHDVAEAKKFVLIGKPGAGKAAELLPGGQFKEVDLNDQLMDQMAKFGQKLEVTGKHIPVQVNQAQHWIPEDWHAYTIPGSKKNAGVIYAKSPDGKWHRIDEQGHKPFKWESSMKNMDSLLESGKMAPYEHPHIHAEHQPPPTDAPEGQPVPGKTTIAGKDGPITVTFDQIQDALSLLNKDKSTQVKLPLKNAGHPLANMDYHAISKEELKNFPELKLAKGSKQAHVGQVKYNILHYLAGVLAEQPPSGAVAEAAQDVAEQTEAEAAYSYDVQPSTAAIGTWSVSTANTVTVNADINITSSTGTVSDVQVVSPVTVEKVEKKVASIPDAPPQPAEPQKVGGISASQVDIAGAIDALEAHPNSTAIKQILKGADNPLQNADYWAVIKQYVATHPGTTVKGNARQVFIDALKTYLGEVKKADVTSLTEAAQELDKLVTGFKGSVLASGSGTLGEALAYGLKEAYQYPDLTWYIKPSAYTPDNYVAVTGEPWHLDEYYKVGPGHTVTKMSNGISADDGKMETGYVLELVKDHLAQPGTPEHKAADQAIKNFDKQFAKDKKAEVKQVPKDQPKPTKPIKLYSYQHGQMEDSGLEVPLDATLYVLSSDKNPDAVWVKHANGSWEFAKNGVLSSTSAYEEDIAKGLLVEAGPDGKPPSKPELSHYEKNLAKASAMDKDMSGWGGGKPLSKKIAQAIADIASSKGDAVFVSPEPDGKGWNFGSKYPSTSPVYKIKMGLGKKVLVGHSSEPNAAFGWLDQQAVEDLLNGKDAKENGVTPQVGAKIENYKVGDYATTPAGTLLKVEKVDDATGPMQYVSGYLPPTEMYPEGPWASFYAADLKPAQTPEAKPPEPEKPAEPAMMKVIEGGEIVEVPAGSKLYHQSYNDGGVDYAKAPDGTWYSVNSYGSHKAGNYLQSSLDGSVEKGSLVETQPLSEEKLAQVATIKEAQKKLKDGVVDPKTKPFTDWKQAAVAGLAANAGVAQVYVYEQEGMTGWSFSKWNPGGAAFKISKVLDVFEAKKGTGGSFKELEGGTAQILAAIDQYLTHDAVVLTTDDGKKLFKYGNYYSPKGKGSYLEIKSQSGTSNYGYHSSYKYGSGANAVYIWHKQNGGKDQISPTAAAVKLKSATEYNPPDTPPDYTPKNPKPQAPVQYATALLGPDVFKFKNEGEESHLKIAADGSGQLIKPGELPVFWTPQDVETALKDGDVVDAYGISVVKPGITPESYHLFGTKLTPKQLDTLQYVFQHYPNDKSYLINQLKQTFAAGTGAQELLNTFTNDKLKKGSTVDWHDQAAGILALIKELKEIPDADPEKLKTPEFEVKYLKGLPPGIASAKDIFQFNAQGYAHPYDGSFPDLATIHYQNATELSAYIKQISAQFGGGKVIGTHPAGLAKDAKVDWLVSFAKGDMAKIFWYDSHGGKVSSAHPGAPDNPDTHQITWAPWGDTEKPAGHIPGGNWSDHTKVTLPQAEVNNYIILAGLQHAEFLTAKEKREWVKYHRQGNQAKVDDLSKGAHYGFTTHMTPSTEPPTWTEDIKPAKSYDVHLEDKTPAIDWPVQAVKDFVADNKALVASYLDKTDPGWTGNIADQYHYNLVPAVQSYLDHLAAVELAEKLKPRYHKTADGEIADQFGHDFFFHQDASTAQPIAVSRLSRLLGYKTPSALEVTLESGEHGLAVEKLDGESLAKIFPHGIDFTEFEKRQLQDIAAEHVLDWMLDNPHGDASKFVSTASGSIVGAGKDGAFSQPFGSWDGLSATPSADSHAKLLYTSFYHAIRAHQISEEDAQAAYVSALRAAWRIQQAHEPRVIQLLSETGAKPAEVMARRAHLAEQVQKMWASVFKDAGWELPEVPPEKLPHGLHSGFSEPSFFDHVMAATNNGIAAFFGGTDLEDASFLVHTELSGENRLIVGESAVRSANLQKLIAWAQSHEGDAVTTTAQKIDIPGEQGLFNVIQKAAKAVSRHAADQMWDGPITKTSLENLALQQEKLTEWAMVVASAKMNGPDTPAWEEFKALGLGDNIAAVEHMIKHYAAQGQKIKEFKEAHQVFHKGDLPRWEPPASLLSKDQAAKEIKIKVEKRKAYRTLNSMGSSNPDSLLGTDGELHLGTQTYDYPGTAWYLTLPTGETIEINDGESTNTPQTHQGRIRFHALASDGSASLERIRAQLQEMGLPLEEATPEDMELFYWRHLSHILAERNDRATGPHKKLWTVLQQHPSVTTSANPTYPAELHQLVESLSALPPDQELELFRKAWGAVTTPQQVEKWVADSAFMPHFGHYDLQNPEVPGGKPFWYNIAHDQGEVAKQQLLTHSMYSGSSRLMRMLRTGGLLSTEARLRKLALWKDGKSSLSDQGHGSAGGVFTYQNKEDQGSYQVYLHPRVLARTSTYSFNGDHFGEIQSRSEHSPFALSAVSKFNGSSNETIIRDAVSVLDDIEIIKAGSEEQRQSLIAELKNNGINEIRGVPVEQRIIVGQLSAARAAVKKVISSDAAKGQLYAHPDEVYIPPPSEQVSAEKSAVSTEAEQKALAQSKATAGSNKVSADHSTAAPVETVSQMFYHAPSAAASPESNVEVKAAVAQRIADNITTTEEQMAALRDAAGLYIQPHWGPDDRVRTVAGLIKTWAQGNSSPIALALQNRAHSVFGLTKEMLPPLTAGGASNEAAAAELESGFGAILDEFLSAMWTLSQQDLAENGIDHLTLYRVMYFSELPAWLQGKSAGDTVDSPAQRPMASWAFLESAPEAAGTFIKSGTKVLVKGTFPRELVITYPRSGFGAYPEAEFVVLDAQGQWEIIKVGP